jgi:hypothetical protein
MTLSVIGASFIYEARVRRTPIAKLKRKDSSQFVICLSSLNGASIPIECVTHHRLAETYPEQRDTGVVIYNASARTKFSVCKIPVPVCETALKHTIESYVSENHFRQSAEDVHATTTVTWWNEWGTKKTTTFAWAKL